MTDYKALKALCAELTNELHGYASANPYHDSDELVARARAALAAEAEGEELRLDGGYESGSMWTGHPLRPAALAAEPEPPCCEAWEDWLESVAWFTDIEDTCRMPHLQDVYHPFNYCPSCGTERRNTHD